MRISLVAIAFCVLVGQNLRETFAQQDASGVRVATVRPAVEDSPKFSFVLFWRENNAPTQAMTQGLKSAVAKRSQRATMSAINVSDPANQVVVKQYQVSRAPMPLVLCVAPNGAITGAITRPITDEAVDRLIVTPAMADVTKALQEKKIVVVHVSGDGRTPLPAGAAGFVADPMYQARTAVVSVPTNNPIEARFVKDLDIRPSEASSSTIVVFAPPSAVVGKFPASATAAQIGTALHAAGKCCDDPNCKHNKKGQ
jgi:hypothetical protein